VIVVDTNILAYRTIPGPRSEETRLLAARDPYWAAPLLWRSELRNVLVGYLRRQTLDVAQANGLMIEAEAVLLGGVHAVEDALVFDLSQRSSCTAYDCEFVALAMALNSPLVTEDQALLRSFPGRCLSLAQMLATA
jgi:predicted nucleic acid-binding protein